MLRLSSDEFFDLTPLEMDALSMFQEQEEFKLHYMLARLVQASPSDAHPEPYTIAELMPFASERFLKPRSTDPKDLLAEWAESSSTLSANLLAAVKE